MEKNVLLEELKKNVQCVVLSKIKWVLKIEVKII